MTFPIYNTYHYVYLVLVWYHMLFHMYQLRYCPWTFQADLSVRFCVTATVCHIVFNVYRNILNNNAFHWFDLKSQSFQLVPKFTLDHTSAEWLLWGNIYLSWDTYSQIYILTKYIVVVVKSSIMVILNCFPTWNEKDLFFYETNLSICSHMLSKVTIWCFQSKYNVSVSEHLF